MIPKQEFDYKTFIKEMKGKGYGLMSEHQYISIADLLSTYVPCNCLVFGLGYDSLLWDIMNKHGTTVFLEDDKIWIKKMSDSFDLCGEIVRVNYTTKVQDYESIGYDPDLLRLQLPDNVRNVLWDFILVDAPLGHQPPRPFKGPGRMSSIFEAHRLLKANGIVVVDDMTRNVERTYANRFFGSDNLFKEVDGKLGFYGGGNE